MRKPELHRFTLSWSIPSEKREVSALIYIVMGPSGSGKTMVGEFLKTKGMRELVSHTTRSPRKGEQDGVAYHFVDDRTFDAIEKIEESTYSGNRYGVSRVEVTAKMGLGDVFAVTEVRGALAFKAKFPKEVRILYIKSSPRMLRSRMRKRGDSKENIRKRLQIFRRNGEACQDIYADAVILNQGSIRALQKRATHCITSARGDARWKRHRRMENRQILFS